MCKDSPSNFVNLTGPVSGDCYFKYILKLRGLVKLHVPPLYTHYRLFIVDTNPKKGNLALAYATYMGL